jgi:peptidoglycan/LPS O-acetylase OafA/YrhL
VLTLPTPLTAPRPRLVPTRTFLPEVQALRAVAVLLVVGYHFWPNRLHGGFVGVDVFFVISGFLITSHLHREVQTRGRIGLANFYARRARRLLPAGLLVLLVSSVGTLALLPAPRWSATAGELLASALYVQNWLLAGRAVDYSASQNAASPVQHFWSLSVEEQFYLFWPGLILLLLLLARRVTRIERDRVLLAGILAVSAVSLLWSVYATATDPAAAYFTTPTRIWELGAGAALALWSRIREQGASAHRAPSHLLPVALRWSGVAAIALAAVLLNSKSPFPGYLALLPVLGTLAVIAGGEPGRRDPAGFLIRQRPVQFLGDVSYSLYLWHWPAIVLLPFALDRTPGARDKLLLLAICIGLAWLTKTLVEDPARRWQLLSRPAMTAVATVAAMLAVSATSVVIWHQAEQEERAALDRLTAASSDPCFGAAALGPEGAGCPAPFGPPQQSLALTNSDSPWDIEPGCVFDDSPRLPMTTCSFSSEPPTRTVALVGDSHALHYSAAVLAIARELNWRVVEIVKGHCPVTHARVLTFDGSALTDTEVEDCRQWTDRVQDELNRLGPDYVLTSGFVGAMQFDENPDRSVETGAQGFVDVWTQWAASGMNVFVLRDVPSTGGVKVLDCLAINPNDPIACSRPRADAVHPDALTVAAERVTSDRVKLVDLTDYFCDDQRCYAVVGGAIVYYDEDHLTSQFARSLAPFLLDEIGGGLG